MSVEHVPGHWGHYAQESSPGSALPVAGYVGALVWMWDASLGTWASRQLVFPHTSCWAFGPLVQLGFAGQQMAKMVLKWLGGWHSRGSEELQFCFCALALPCSSPWDSQLLP